MNNYNYVHLYQIKKALSIVSIDSKENIFDFQVKEFKDTVLGLLFYRLLKIFALLYTIITVV